MDTKKLIEKLSLTDSAVALGGCRNEGTNFDCCEYNITVFDDKTKADTICDFENEMIKLQHGSMKEKRPEILTQYLDMKILWDEKWELRTFLTNLREKKERIVQAYTKSCLIDAIVCTTKTIHGIENSDPFASSWLKCSAYYIADAISLANARRPSPTHMLESIRGFEKNKINESFSAVNDCIGIERATTSLLERMSKSTIGFSDMVEKTGHSKIIQKKYDYLVKNSLLADCYFYLGYINRNNLIKIKDSLHRKPELIHVLKVGFDVDNDLTRVERNAVELQKTANHLHTLINQ